MFPYVLYQRFAAATPEFEQMAAFEAGRSQFSARRGEFRPGTPAPAAATLFRAITSRPLACRHMPGAP